MSDPRAKQKQAGVFVDAKEIDVQNVSIDPALGKVWSDEGTGEIAVSIERVLFDNLLDIAARYLEPQGYSLNLENLLATIDSMRLGAFAAVSSRPGSDGRAIAKKLMPAVYMHLPRKNLVGPLLQRFYDEVGRYERELARLQEFESKSKKVIEAAVRDQTGRQAVEALRLENLALRDELTRLSGRLARAEEAMRAVPVVSSTDQFPVGVRSCVVRAIRPGEGVVLLKSGDQQFSVSLKAVGGIPEINARALSFHEGGVLRSVWVFDPAVRPFKVKLATVLGVDARRVKVRFGDRHGVIL